ncbi:hypothetical protein WN944_027057 [Citrus x changshan-huyou]|uniref:Uncharacterized protein n=1 Tax=Citrus x changshan-huyou TaxID=2935761 RepID=A0AAP0Q7V1_9ROSI
MTLNKLHYVVIHGRPRISPITFTRNDLEGIYMPHIDPLVVTLEIANITVKRILIDGGSNAEILYWDAFQKMRLKESDLRKCYAPLVAFEGIRLTAKGIINLPIKAGDKIASVDFLVVNAPSSYNAILGRL